MLFFSHRINELQSKILNSSPKEHEEKEGVLEKDETKSLTDVIMEQIGGKGIDSAELYLASVSELLTQGY